MSVFFSSSLSHFGLMLTSLDCARHELLTKLRRSCDKIVLPNRTTKFNINNLVELVEYLFIYFSSNQFNYCGFHNIETVYGCFFLIFSLTTTNKRCLALSPPHRNFEKLDHEIFSQDCLVDAVRQRPDQSTKPKLYEQVAGAKFRWRGRAAKDTFISFKQKVEKRGEM